MMARNSRNLKAIVTKYSLKERFKTAQSYLQKLKNLIEDVSANIHIYVYCFKLSNVKLKVKLLDYKF